MATIPFHTLWPSGNTTAIVEQPVSRQRQAAVARAIMQARPQIEQVGYIEPAQDSRAALRLQMMGGEFCGNAARAAAHFWASRHGFGQVRIEVSGAVSVLTVETTPTTAKIVLPGDFFRRRQQVAEGCVVDLQGIRHVLVADEAILRDATQVIAKYSGDQPALGVVYIQRAGALIKNRPRIWVRATNTCVDETACGSGSIAAAIAAYDPATDCRTFAVEQPSREICTVCLQPAKAGFTSISLSGIVKLLGQDAVAVA